MKFDMAYWKAAIQTFLPEMKQDFKGAVYTTLCAAAFLPLFTGDLSPAALGPIMFTLGQVLSGVGGDLLSNKVQEWLGKPGITRDELAELIESALEENAALTKEFDHVLQQLDVIAQADTKLSETDKIWFHQTLHEELEHLPSDLRVIYNQGGLYYEYIHIVNGDFIAGDKITYIYRGEDVTPLVESYHRNLSSRCQQLPLGIIDEKYINPQGKPLIKLQDIYTELDVAAIHKEKDESVDHYGWRLSRSEEGDREPILDAIARADLPCITLLGDAGSGKTTFINYLTYCLLSKPEGLPDALRGKPVINLTLRDALPHLNASTQADTAELLWKTLETDIQKRIGASSAQKVLLALQQKVTEAPCLILLDGLDEITEVSQHRENLIKAVQDLRSSLKEGSRMIMSARPYAYAKPEWQLEGFTALTLKPFNKQQAEYFISAWYNHIQTPLDEVDEILKSRADSLKKVVQEKDYLAALASRPILLTLITTLHTRSGTLPEDRAQLYNDSVELLIDRWQRKYGAEQEVAENQPQANAEESTIQKLFRYGTVKIRKVMETVACDSHQKQQKLQTEHADVHMQCANITRSELEGAFSPFLPDDLNARVVVDYLEHQAGLLIAREPGVFIFPHRTFQEFLAACHILKQPRSTQTLLEHLRKDGNWWREVYLLAVGRKKPNLDDAVGLINALLQTSVDEKEHITDQDWHAASLAGEGLLEIRLVEDQQASRAYQGLIERIRNWLTRLVVEGHLDAKSRLKAGDTLGQIGDFRKGVNVIVHQDITIPDLDWVYIHEGEFLMGSIDFDENAREDEKPQHLVHLPSFWISRYPITNVQYSLFVDEECYSNKDYWSDAGWEWLEETRRKSIEEPHLLPFRYPHKPYGWNFKGTGTLNRPVVGISWHEAFAYSRWLQERYLACSYSLNIEDKKLMVIIPTEEQWEKAIRGLDGIIYPWGNNWELGMANTKEEELFTTSTVGMFPKGKSKDFEILDGVGNVNEWTSTPVGNHPNKPSCIYPHHLESVFVDDSREYYFLIVKGGCSHDNKNGSRCASRGASARLVWGLNFGFRLCLIKT